jgi:hypothetical protein
MDRDEIIFWVTLSGAACWAICFWWMHNISTKQKNVLVQLREQGERIEQLSREEHKLIKEVHPQVGEIKAGVDRVISEVENSERTALP